MNRQMFLVSLIFVVMLAACGGRSQALVPTAVPVPPTDVPTEAAVPEIEPAVAPSPEATVSLPAAIVMETAERYNAGDLEGTLAYWADDAVFYMVGMPPTGMEMALGKEQIGEVFAENLANNGRWEVEVIKVRGDEVVAKAKNWHDFTRQLGVAPLEAYGYYTIKEGLIDTYTWVLEEEAALKLKGALAEAMIEENQAQEALPEPVSEVTVTYADGTCHTDRPVVLRAGPVQVTAVAGEDEDVQTYAISFFTLEEGKDLIDLMASTNRATPPSWSRMFWFAALEPGTSEQYEIAFEEGAAYLICWVDPPETPIGNAELIVVAE